MRSGCVTQLDCLIKFYLDFTKQNKKSDDKIYARGAVFTALVAGCSQRPRNRFLQA